MLSRNCWLCGGSLIEYKFGNLKFSTAEYTREELLENFDKTLNVVKINNNECTHYVHKWCATLHEINYLKNLNSLLDFEQYPCPYQNCKAKYSNPADLLCFHLYEYRSLYLRDLNKYVAHVPNCHTYLTFVYNSDKRKHELKTAITKIKNSKI